MYVLALPPSPGKRTTFVTEAVLANGQIGGGGDCACAAADGRSWRVVNGVDGEAERNLIVTVKMKTMLINLPVTAQRNVWQP